MGHQNFCFLKMIFLKKKVVRDVYISIMNYSAKFQSSNIIIKGVQICPILKKGYGQICPTIFHGAHLSHHQCQPRSHWSRHEKKKTFFEKTKKKKKKKKKKS